MCRHQVSDIGYDLDSHCLYKVVPWMEPSNCQLRNFRSHPFVNGSFHRFCRQGNNHNYANRTQCNKCTWDWWFERFLGLAGALSRQTPSLSKIKQDIMRVRYYFMSCDNIIYQYILYVSVIIANRTDEIVQFLVEGVSTQSTEKGVCYRSCAEFMICLWEILSNSFEAAPRHVMQHDRCLENEQCMSRARIHLFSLSLPSKSSPCVFVSMQFVG